MKWWMIVGLLVIGLVVAQSVGVWRASRTVDGLIGGLAGNGGAVRQDLPDPVRRYAERVGADGQVRLVRYTQSADLELSPGEGWQPFTAQQWVDPRRAGFVWLAEQRMLGLPVVRVVDSFVAGKGLLVAWLLGSVPVARADGADMDRAEAMRYLAELPWAPDAILLNHDLVWQVLEPDRWRVSLNDATVDMHLDTEGDIVSIRAEDRPSLEGGQMILRDWRGEFRDYAMMGGRRIPVTAQVGYVFDEQSKPYFKGRVTGYFLE